jgi:nucleoside-diphosphate-sugar epimerase
MKILVTGATGFVGRELLGRLAKESNYNVRVALRQPVARLEPGIESALVRDFNSSDCSSALDSCDVVIHLAARVHVMREPSADSLSAFRRTNVDGTLALANRAADAGVRRFIFLSSIKVNGEKTPTGRPFRADDPPNPSDAYGFSKLEAEQGLQEIARLRGMEVIIVRSPLVYGPGVRANFLEMMQWLYRGMPLPFGAVTDNRRSLISLENLSDLILTCVGHPSLGSRVLLASDGEDLSTADLLTRIGLALGRPARLISVPTAIVRSMATLVGRGNQVRRLLGSLQIDLSATRQLLAWSPPTSVDRELARTAADFLRKIEP